MDINERALLEILRDTINVTQLLLDDYLRLAERESFLPSPKLAQLLPTIRAQHERVQAIVGRAT